MILYCNTTYQPRLEWVNPLVQDKITAWTCKYQLGEEIKYIKSAVPPEFYLRTKTVLSTASTTFTSFLKPSSNMQITTSLLAFALAISGTTAAPGAALE